MFTKLKNLDKISKSSLELDDRENDYVLLPRDQFPHLFISFHSQAVKRNLEEISKDALDFEGMVKTYQLSFDLSQLPSDDAMKFLEMTETLRSLLRDFHSFKQITKPFFDEAAA